MGRAAESWPRGKRWSSTAQVARSPALLRPEGTLVAVKADPPPPASRDDIRTVAFIQESSRAELIELARLVDEGHLRPQVGAVYPLAQAAKAYSAKASGGIPGRIVLQPWPQGRDHMRVLAAPRV
jgi:NADPH:quinone reductase-like Zn-dependent oxidoreductase